MKNSGFKMKGHTLPGPNQKSSPAKVIDVVAKEAAKQAAKEVAKKAAKEIAKKALIESVKKAAGQAAVEGAVQIGVNKISESGKKEDKRPMDQDGFSSIKFGR